MSYKKYKIESFRDVLKRFRFPRFTKLAKFWDVMIRSSKKSKTNFFFQVANLSIIWLLILIVFPDRSSQWFSLFEEFRWFFVPVGQIATASVFYILTQTFLNLFNFSWSSLFETAPKVTALITIILVAVIIALFNKLIIALKDRAKQDLILWRTSK